MVARRRRASQQRGQRPLVRAPAEVGVDVQDDARAPHQCDSLVQVRFAAVGEGLEAVEVLLEALAVDVQRQARLGGGLQQLEAAPGADVLVHEGRILAEAHEAGIGRVEPRPGHGLVQRLQRGHPLGRESELDRPLEDLADARLLGGPWRRVGLVEGAAEQDRDRPRLGEGPGVDLARGGLADGRVRAESNVREVIWSVYGVDRVRVAGVDGQDGSGAGAAVEPLHVGEGIVDELDHLRRTDDLADRAALAVAPLPQQGEGVDQGHRPGSRLAPQRRGQVRLGGHIQHHRLIAARGEGFGQAVGEDPERVIARAPLDQNDAHGRPPWRF